MEKHLKKSLSKNALLILSDLHICNYTRQAGIWGAAGVGGILRSPEFL
jgi:hypothetical protein